MKKLKCNNFNIFEKLSQNSAFISKWNWVNYIFYAMELNEIKIFSFFSSLLYVFWYLSKTYVTEWMLGIRYDIERDVKDEREFKSEWKKKNEKRM
jgi:hypothetical protein